MKDIPDFVDKAVFKDLNKSSFWLRIYSSFLTLNDFNNDYLKKIFEKKIDFKNSNLSMICSAIKEELELPVIEQGFLYRDLHGGIKINHHIVKKKLPAGFYVFLTMPYKMALLHPKLYFNLFAIFGINFSYF